MSISNETERLEAKFEIVQNNNPALPYRLTFESGPQRTIEADFNLDFQKLSTLFSQGSPAEYGEYLYEQVFEQSINAEKNEKGKLNERLHSLLSTAEDEASALRIELKIKNNLPQLQAISWEYLFDKKNGIAIAADHRLSFFRNLDIDSPQRKAITGIPRVLAAIICPSESSLAQLNRKYSTALEPISYEEEKNRLETLLKNIRVQFDKTSSALLYQIVPSDKSTLDDLCKILGDDGQFHVLHLTCHGMIINGKSFLVLADTDGKALIVSEEEFAKKFIDKKSLRLVLLDACQSARQSGDSAFSGITSQLLNHVPAAIGMQRVWYTATTDDHFIDCFYRQLCQHGSVDIALQQARKSLRQWKPDRWEWGTPVLYLRLGKGQLFRPEKKKSSKAPKETRSQKGTGLHIGGKASLKNVVFDVDAAGGDIVTGTPPPTYNFEARGKGIQIVGGTLEGVTVKGKYAAGSIYKQALDKQNSETFTKDFQLQVVQEKIKYYNRKLQNLKNSIDTGKILDKDQAREELNDICHEIREIVNPLSDNNYLVLSALASCVSVIDKMADPLSELIEKRQSPIPIEHRLKIEKVNQEIVTKTPNGITQRINGDQIRKVLSKEDRNYVMVLEQAMQNHYELWTQLHLARSKSQDPATNADLEKKLLNLVGAMKSDLGSILDFLEKCGIQLDDHYLRIRDIIESSIQ